MSHSKQNPLIFVSSQILVNMCLGFLLKPYEFTRQFEVSMWFLWLPPLFCLPKKQIHIHWESLFKATNSKNVDRLNDRLSHTKLLNLYMYFWDFYFQTWTKFALFFNFSLISNSPLLDHSRHLPAPALRYKHKLKCSIIHKTEIPHHDLYLKHIKGRNIYFVTG